MNNRPLISIILVTHNREHLLRRTLASIAHQRYRRFELVLVDDASTDGTYRFADIRRGYALTYLRSARQEGLAKGRNRGVRHARGDLLVYVDDDEILYPGHLQTLAGGFRRWPRAGVVYGDCVCLFDGRSRVVPFSVDFDRARLEIANYIPGFCYAHRRSCLDHVGGFDESVPFRQGLEDWDFLLRLADRYAFRHVKKVVGEHLYHGKNMNACNRLAAPYLRLVTKRAQVFAARGKTPFSGYFVATMEQMTHCFFCAARSRQKMLEIFRARYPRHTEVCVAEALHALKMRDSRALNEALGRAQDLLRTMPRRRLSALERVVVNGLTQAAMSGNPLAAFDRSLLQTVMRAEQTGTLLVKAVRRFLLHRDVGDGELDRRFPYRYGTGRSGGRVADVW